jgi:branched-chain amino acid aminotransferase
VNDGKIYTPPIGNSVLPGITRDTVIRLAQDLGYTVIEQPVAREALYIYDEVFFCGTAAEVTPIRSVDRIVVGQGRRGPVTTAIQEEFFAIVEGRKEDRYGWLTPVGVNQPASALR